MSNNRARYAKPPQELWQELDEQLAALRASAEGYDAGRGWEAKRLASIVDILVHDRGRRTVSLLTQLGLKDGFTLLASGPPINERNLLTEMPLVMMRVGTDGACYLPVLGDSPHQPPRRLPFSRWWEEPVLRDTNRRLLSRKNLVCSLRDQDGGAHSDGTLDDEAYVSISRKHGAGWEYTTGGTQSRPIAPGPHLATMRQIAWELEQTLAAIERPAT